MTRHSQRDFRTSRKGDSLYFQAESIDGVHATLLQGDFGGTSVLLKWVPLESILHWEILSSKRFVENEIELGI